MKMRSGLVVTGMMLVLVAPAAAKDRRPEAGAASRIATTALPNPMNPGARQIVDLDARGIVIDHPSGTRMLGQLPLAENANVGVGLFSVVGSTEKEQLRRRMDPSRAYRPSETHVAAVGFNLSF